MMGRASSLLFCGTLALSLGSMSGQLSSQECVQVTGVGFSQTCPCDAADSVYEFQIEARDCPATNAAILFEFNGVVSQASVVSGTASFAGSEVTFQVPDLEAAPTFSVSLDICAETVGDTIVTFISYRDDQGNLPELERLDVGSYRSCEDGEAQV